LVKDCNVPFSGSRRRERLFDKDILDTWIRSDFAPMGAPPQRSGPRDTGDDLSIIQEIYPTAKKGRRK
jgi:hypothetical protein